MATTRRLTVALVDDADVLRAPIKQKLSEVWDGKVEIVVYNDWPDFAAGSVSQRAAPFDPDDVDLVISDINLKGEGGPKTKAGWKLTEFDGLRVFGLVAKKAPHIPCILYTGFEPAELALDQFDDPSAPLWVVPKARDDRTGVVAAASRKLADVADRILRSTSLSERKALADAVESETDLGHVRVRHPRAAEEVHYRWDSILTALAANNAAAAGGSTRAEWRTLLRSYLPTGAKALVVSRFCKPKEFTWTSETFGIQNPRDWLEGSGSVRSAAETVLHTDALPTGDAQRGWCSALDTALREYHTAVESMLLESTRDLCQNAWNTANGLKTAMSVSTVSEQRARLDKMRQAQTAVKDRCLQGRWKQVIQELGIDLIASDSEKVIGYPHYSEWSAITRALQLLQESRREAVGADCINAPSVEVGLDDSSATWKLRMVLSDSGQGMPDLSLCFLNGPDNRPTEQPSRTHKLQLAQARLWGYCKWGVVTKGQDDTRLRSWDVFAERAEVDWIDAVAMLNGRGSGTVHVLEFDNPLPVSSWVLGCT